MPTETEKFIEAKPRAAVLSEFLDWLAEEGISLARPVPEFDDHAATHAPITEGNETLLSRFFGIDQEKLEEERREVLRALREKHASKEKW